MFKVRTKKKHWINMLNVKLDMFKINNKYIRATTTDVILVTLLFSLNTYNTTFNILNQCFCLWLWTFNFRGVFRIAKMELFMRLVNGFHPLTIFTKKLHLRCLAGFWIRLWIAYWKWSLKWKTSTEYPIHLEIIHVVSTQNFPKN